MALYERAIVSYFLNCVVLYLCDREPERTTANLLNCYFDFRSCNLQSGIRCVRTVPGERDGAAGYRAL
jgi:hypothetical protein